MKFNELREANLSKAQIKKVHDKADEMPKSDFIKRYGKEGDAVRFATATNQVKKELGLEGYTSGPGTSRGRQGDGTYPRGYDPQAKPITLPVELEKTPKSLLKRIFSDLDKEDEKSVGRVVKGLKKAVKAHQGQVDALTKDIKDETELDEFIAPVARVIGKAAVPVAKAVGKIAYKGAKVAVKKGTPIVKKGVKVAIKKGTPIVKKVGKEVGKAALDVAVDVGQGVGDLAKKGAKAAAAVKQKTKDKADVQRLLDRQKRLRAVGKRNEEVELDEVHFSNRGETPAPKGMHKLRSGRDIPSSPQVDKIHKKVVKMTDRNDHFGAKIEIAKACGDKKLVQIYNALELMHDKYGVVGNKSIELRQIFEPVLNNAIDRKFGKYADVIRDAT